MTTAIAVTANAGQFWSWRGHAIHYVQMGAPHGTRPPLLLIHGFGASTDHWRKNLADLQADFQVWAVDLLGFGRSAKPDVTYSGDLWRDQIQAFIQTHIQRPVVLVGNSLGGYASLCVAADHPDSVAGVILLNSAGPFTPDPQTATPPTPDWKRAIGGAVQTFMLQPLPSWLLFQYVRQRRTIRKTLKQVYVDHSAITDQLIEDIRRPAADPGAAQVFAAVFKAPQGDRVDVLLQRMQAPLYLMWGEGDPWMNARDRSAQFRRHYDQVQDVFLQAGHCPHDEVPQQVNPLIRQWVLSLP